MSKKPVGVLILGWLFLVLAALKLLGLLMVIGNRPDGLKPLVLIIEVASLPLYLAIGLGFLAGANWSRILYLVVGLVSLFAGIVLGGFNVLLLVRALVFGGIAFYLFRPRVTSFFRHEKNPNQASEVTARKLAEPQG